MLRMIGRACRPPSAENENAMRTGTFHWIPVAFMSAAILASPQGMASDAYPSPIVPHSRTTSRQATTTNLIVGAIVCDHEKVDGFERVVDFHDACAYCP